MEWLVAGVVGQLVALRLLTWALAWEPGHFRRVWRRPERAKPSVRRNRQRRLVLVAAGMFAVATAVAVAGLVAVVVG